MDGAGGEEGGHRWLEKAGAALLWRKAFCCRSHSSRLTDRKASEHDAITGHDASRHSLDSHGEAPRLEKDQQKAPISARWHASLKDLDTMRQYSHTHIHIRARAREKKFFHTVFIILPSPAFKSIQYPSRSLFFPQSADIEIYAEWIHYIESLRKVNFKRSVSIQWMFLQIWFKRKDILLDVIKC